MYRWDIINRIAEKLGHSKYLEIGVQNGESISKVKIKYKVGVDPDLSSKASHKMTSDEFFSKNKEKFDIVFIDGLHTAEQSYKDFENALKVLGDCGVIVWHDCLPKTEKMSLVPRETREWTGDVYKGFLKARAKYNKMKSFVIDTDYGVGVFMPYIFEENNNKDQELSFDEWDANKKELMNIITKEEFNGLLF